MTYVDIVKIYKDFLDSRDADEDIFCMRARKVLEAMVENLILKNEIHIDKNSSLLDKITIVEDNNIIDQDSIQNYHFIRKQTNSNIHVGNDSISKQEKKQVESYIVLEIEKYGKYIVKEPRKTKQVKHITESSTIKYPVKPIQSAVRKPVQKQAQKSSGAGVFVFIAIIVIAVLMYPTIVESIKEHKLQKEQNFYEEAIANYVPNSLDQITLMIDENAKPGAAVWCEDGNGSTYTSDSAIVEIDSSGTMTGVGEGSAYVVIRGIGDMHKVYKIKVVKNYYGISYLERFAGKFQ